MLSVGPNTRLAEAAGANSALTAMKIVGAAAAKKYPFDKCVALGRAVNAAVVSIGSALDHCHVPGRQKNETLPADVCVVGAGIHNEPVSSTHRVSISDRPAWPGPS